MSLERRTSSNGVKNLRAIFERESSASPSSEQSRSSISTFGAEHSDHRQSGYYKRITTSFTSVEPKFRNMAVKLDTNVAAALTDDAPPSPASGSIREHSRHGETELDLRIAVIKLTNDTPRILLLRHVSEPAGQFEFPGSVVKRNDSSTAQVMVSILRTQTGLLPVRVFDKIPGHQETVTYTSSRITFVVSAVSEDIKLNPKEHSEALWAAEEEIADLHLGPAVADTVAQALKMAPLVLSNEDDTEANDIEEALKQHMATATEINGHADAEPERHQVELPATNGQSEHTEKVVSATEDPDAQLQSTGITDEAVISRGQSGTKQANTNSANLDDRAAAGEVEQADHSNIPAKRLSTATSSSKESSQNASRRTSNGLTSATAASSSRAAATVRTRNNASTKTLTGTIRGAPKASSSSTGPAKSNTSTQSSRLSSHLIAPTAASSARQSSGGVPTRTPSLRTKSAIGTSSHLLAPTASSAARDHHNPDTSGKTTTLPDRSVSAPRRDRTSLASTTNGTVRKPPATNPRSSLQPPAGSTSTTKPTNGAAATSAASVARKPTGGDFLSRMTRPTAASSNRAQPENKNPLSQSTTSRPASYNPSTVRGKLGAAAASGTLRRTAAATATQKAKGGNVTANAGPPANGDAPATPVSNGGGKVNGTSEDEAGVAESLQTNGEALQNGVAGQHADNEMEARLMETPDLGEAVIR